jgi:hypothetical protein
VISGALFKSWLRVFLHPWSPVFRDELNHKSNLHTLVGVVAGALLGLGLSWLIHLLSGQPTHAYRGIASAWVGPGTQPPFSSWALISPLGVILGFYDFEIVLFIFARLLGGKGSFGAQAYAQSLFYAPLAIVQQLFAVLPGAGRPLFILRWPSIRWCPQTRFGPHGRAHLPDLARRSHLDTAYPAEHPGGLRNHNDIEFECSTLGTYALTPGG